MRVFDQNFKKNQTRLLPIDHLLPAIEKSSTSFEKLSAVPETKAQEND